MADEMICPFCGQPARWVNNKEIYGGKSFGKSYMAWWCKPCDARVGCHQNSKRPLGTMADAETRRWRRMAHEAFDPLWKGGWMKRDRAYKRLARRMRIEEEVHIGAADVAMCKRIIKAVSEIKANINFHEKRES